MRRSRFPLFFFWAILALPLWQSVIMLCKWLLIQKPAFGTAPAKEAGLWGILLSYPF